MSSFVAKKLDNMATSIKTRGMGASPPAHKSKFIARLVRNRIEQGGEKLWRHQDFRDLPFTPVARALSRLAEQGIIERLSKGVYYHARSTSFGKSLPNPTAVQKLASDKKRVFPSGVAAANLLGFTTQTARRNEVSTIAGSLPRKLMGTEAVIHTHRPAGWATLADGDAALLDFLRRGGRTSELSPKETVARTVSLLSEKGRFERLLKIADSEPPRVRALMGAIGDEIGMKPGALARLRRSLNPLSRFDFGQLAGLPSAPDWQAKGRQP
jgi:Family of unknown function (DUF6088)